MADRQDEVAIKVSNVSKSFKLPHEKHTSVKGALIGLFNSNRSYEKQQVLKDISFDIQEGEFFGIVGRNGSGKSTLLKMLAGIYEPNNGAIHINGKLTPFIELGVGFNPNLTGRENVYLNGALLGFNRKEMDAMYNEIVDFAELHKFMDQKLKNYSSGMQVRLAFSIAIRAQSDILLLDEVLAVGDEAFQKKCVDIFENYKATKQTVILVTHDMETVKKYCSRAMLIDKGEILTIGSPTKTANVYTELNNEASSEETDTKNEKNSKQYTTTVKLTTKSLIAYGDTVRLEIDWSKHSGSVQNIGVAIYKNTGEYVFGANTILDDVKLKDSTSLGYSVKAELGVGSYHFKVGLFGKQDSDIIEFIDHGPEFTVKNDNAKWEGITLLNHSWEK